jgi:LAGLIDADG DNA endonuclease family protein
VRPATERRARFLGGFIAGEGTFFHSGTPPKFVFAVGLGAQDATTCELIATFLGVGHIHHSPRRKPHYDDEVTFAIQSLRDHLRVTIPFMDAHLPESHKRTQYLAWRAELLDYWERRAKRRRPCTVDSCDAPQRAHGYCRRHLWTFRRE